MAVALGIILQFATWLPVGAISQQNYVWGVGMKMALSLVPNLCLSYAFGLIIGKELDTSGMNWSSLASPISTVDDLTLLHMWTMFLLDFLIYMIILWYMDNVRPGKYGLAKKFYFPFQVRNLYLHFFSKPLTNTFIVKKSYWFGESADKSCSI